MTAAQGEPTETASWPEANQKWILASLGVLRTRLSTEDKDKNSNGDEPERVSRTMSSPPALEWVASTFGLSPFERDVLLLAAGVELDASFASAVAEAQRDTRNPLPTFGLALATLRDPHWSALAPARPLRHWHLVEVGAGSTLTGRPIQVDERLLHHIVGIDYVDSRIAHVLEDVRDERPTASQAIVANQIVSVWESALESGDPLPIIQLRGTDTLAKQAIARRAADETGLRLLAVGQVNALDDALLATLIAREMRLSRAALVVLADDAELSPAAVRWLERTNDPVIVAMRDRPITTRRPTLILDVEKPLHTEQRTLWTNALSRASDEDVDRVVAHFDLGSQAIRAAASAAAAAVAAGASRDVGTAMWESCRRLARPRLEGLAQRIVPAATWDDLVVSDDLQNLLELVATHVARRTSVHEQWSFTRRGSRGLGITALFSGPSGTGKTLAAEVLANELGLDLFRVDLSQVISKYIGETEKNLRRVFDAAEDACAVLLFDEADALFGKRSDVKDSHDRYANIEVSYLLQRMESYRGLAILTTNLKGAMDTAFLRRIQFVAQFPFPNADQRLAIWTRFFPEGSHVEDLDRAKLAQMDLAGGNIYNVARNAAFLAAEAGTPVRMEHVLRAARDEFAKLERPANLPKR